jgi:hypothetical protein
MTTTAYLAKDKFNHAIQALLPSTTQTVAISGTSAATTNALSKNIVVIRVLATTACFINIGTGTPTATTSNTPLAANIPEYFRVNGNETIKVAGIQLSTSGSLYVTEMI